MNDAPAPRTTEDAITPNRALVTVLRVLLWAEAVLMIGVAVWFGVELGTAEPASATSAIALTVLAVIGAVFMTAVAVAAVRNASWIRGAAFTWQVLQLAVAVGAFQGLYAQPGVGWALLVPSVAVMVLLVLPSVRVVFLRTPDDL